MNDKNDALEKILQKLTSLEGELQSVSQRIESLEREQKPDTEARPDPVSAPAEQFPAEPKPPTPSPKPPPLPALQLPPAPVVAAAPEPAAAQPLDGVLQGMDPEPLPGLPPAPPPAAATAPPGGREPAKPRESLEMRIAGTWLPRIGILFLALVLVLLAREHVRGPLGKVLGAYALSVILAGVGLFYEKRYPRWAGPVLAGGLAFSYFASYAMGFVEPMRLLNSLPLKLAVLGANLALIFGFAQWKKSEAMAGTALLLGYLTTGVVGNDVAALASCVALSLISVIFLWRNQWFISTAVASGASYAAFLYVQQAVPEAITRTGPSGFWFQALFLTLLFVVFVVAGWVGAQALERSGELADSDRQQDGRNKAGRLGILATLTQTNVFGYGAAMVWVLYHTQIYWTRAWGFFFPMAAVCALLGWLFWRVRPVRLIYFIAAAASLAFGLMSAASPMWLPILLATQAVVMLAGGRRQQSMPWSLASFVVLVYAGCHLALNGMTGGEFVSNDAHSNYPWWTFISVSLMALWYGAAWEKWMPRPHSNSTLAVMPYLPPLLGAMLWSQAAQLSQSEWSLVLAAAGVPVAAMLMVAGRVKGPIAFLVLVGLASLVYQGDSAKSALNWWIAGYWIVIAAAFVTGLWAERTGIRTETPGSASADRLPKVLRLLWRAIYLWAQALAAIVILRYCGREWGLTALAAMVCGSVAAGCLLRSAALAKSGVVTLFLLGLGAVGGAIKEPVYWALLVTPWALLVAAYPLGLTDWQARTGDRSPQFARMAQAAMVGIAGWIWVFGTDSEPWLIDPIFSAGMWTLVAALFAAAGLFSSVVWIATGYAAIAALLLLGEFLNGYYTGSEAYSLSHGTGSQVAWALVGVVFIVAAERVLRLAPHFATRRKTMASAPWPSEKKMAMVTTWMAVGTLGMTVVAVRLMPELRLFYFTGSMVAAAFLWIVLGFWFREGIYRRSGLILLCAGIVKGLVWDVLSLKNTVYRQVSWTVLGLLAIAASFLYNKFRGRIEKL